MAWTTPMTAVDNAVWTSAQFNVHVRDNLNETMVAKASAAGRWVVVSGTSALTERTITETDTAASSTTTSTSYTDLAAGAAPVVTITTGTAAIAFFGAQMSNSSANATCSISVGITSATTRAASDTWRACTDGHTAGDGMAISSFYKFTGLTAGSNVFTMKYKVSAGTGTFLQRQLLIMPL